MGVFGYPLYPPKNGIRIFHSDFPIYSDKIRSFVKSFNADLRNSNRKYVEARKRISWSAGDYCLGKKEARFALALNPAHVFLKAQKKDYAWEIEVSVKVKIEYVRNARIVLLPVPKLAVEEGIFWVLQKTGWLYPYVAEWRFTLHGNDRRIN